MRKKNDYLSSLRKRFGKTQEDCAKALGVYQSNYARRETGETPLKRRDKAALAMLFGIPLGEAFPDEAEEPARAA